MRIYHSMHNAQFTMHNEGIAFGDVMAIRPFTLTIMPKISVFASLTSPNGHLCGEAAHLNCALCIVNCELYGCIKVKRE